jgi:hypothetical protein
MTFNSNTSNKPVTPNDDFDLMDEDEEPTMPQYKVRTPEESMAFLQRLKDEAEAKKVRMTPEEFFALPEAKQWEFSRDESYGKWEFYQALWTPVDWTRQLENDVMLGTQCPMCLGVGEVPAILKGERTGAYKKDRYICHCDSVEERLYFLSNPWGIPKKYLFADLQTLQPIPTSPLTMARQAEEIEFLRQHPSDSYFLCGRPGTSKTTYTSALIRYAYDQWWGFLIKQCRGSPIKPSWFWIWRINFDVLMGQIQRYEYRTFGSKEEVSPPDLTPTRIAKAASEVSPTRGRPLLCIEEIDKAKMTVDRLNRLEALVDAVYNGDGQLLLTTNLTYAAFAATVIDTKPETGEPLMRRIEEICHIREYF